MNRITIRERRRIKLAENKYLKEEGDYVRRGSHWGGSPQNGLRNEQTCGMTLASAYVLCHLSATWSQLQMMGKSLRQK